MRTRQRLLLSLLALAFLACLAATAVSVSQQLRQDRLDRALIRAVKALDAPGVERLLAEGANANARDSEEPPLTLMGLVKRAIARLQRTAVSSGTDDSALNALFWDNRIYRRGKNSYLAFAPTDTQALDSIGTSLIQHGASVHSRVTYFDCTPLSMAAGLGMCRTARALIARGADVNEKMTTDTHRL